MIDDRTHPLFGVSLKIQRASDQLKALSPAIKEFLDSKPYELEPEIHTDTENVFQIFRRPRDCDPMWSAIIGEIVHNLRCALDYIVFQLVILETGTEPGDDTKIQFPIFKTENGFNSRGAPTMLKGVGVKAQTLIKSLQPFATGEGEQSPLWVLRELSNWDKHRSIHVAAASTSSIAAGGQFGPIKGVIVGPGGILKDNTVAYGAIVAPGPEPLLERVAKVQVQGEITLHVAFNKPISLQSLPVQRVLDVIGQRVFEIAKRISTEIFSR